MEESHESLANRSKMVINMKKIIIIFCIILFAYYQLDYKRDFIYSNDKTKVFTIWKRAGYNFYIIPGKYYSPFTPKGNYIYGSNQSFGVIFNTDDSYDYKLGVFYKKITPDFNPKIKVYKQNENLLLENKILDSINKFSHRWYSPKNKDSIVKSLDYKYIDIKRIYGIKIIYPNKD
jgi:hypothetical protein